MRKVHRGITPGLSTMFGAGSQLAGRFMLVTMTLLCVARAASVIPLTSAATSDIGNTGDEYYSGGRRSLAQLHPDTSPNSQAGTAVNSALSSVNNFYGFASGMRLRQARVQGINAGHSSLEQSALSSCLLVLQGSQDLLQASLHPLSNLAPSTFEQQITDSLTWVSAALTFHTTCLDSYEGVYGSATKDSLLSEAQGVTSVLADAVSVVAALATTFSTGGFQDPVDQAAVKGNNRRLLESQIPGSTSANRKEKDDSLVYGLDQDGFPEWMGREDRRILKTSSTTNLTLVNAVVAKDGSGQYHTVQAAINAAPQNSASRWTIRVKAGLYNEIVTIPSTATNLMLMGDGAGQTIITGNLSVGGSNVTTYLSATVSSLAANVIIRDMTIRNTAGAKNFQAVALKVGGDQTAVWRCSLEGYQDTLYALSQRQFYKSCTIYGTVDFIFGNAAAVFQTCTLLARAPIPGQQNTFTAQGRTIQAQNTGFSFQNCTIDAAPELKAAQSAGQFVASYLGRPWKLYSRTVYLQNSMSSVINPAGWLPWNGSFALSTLFYGEYKNTGPGAATGQRVSWSTQITSSKVATQYTVDNFISGALWLPQTTIDFFPQLISTSTGKKLKL
ncbi:hypothetical protein CY35_13G026100 [Sphagnum magellanicum]|nr:hypothetical protein CY35_13G026100 [Sphagnum magellanicum]